VQPLAKRRVDDGMNRQGQEGEKAHLPGDDEGCGSGVRRHGSGPSLPKSAGGSPLRRSVVATGTKSSRDRDGVSRHLGGQ